MDYPVFTRTYNGGKSPADALDILPKTKINNSKMDRCQRRGCKNSLRFRSTGNLCMACWTEEHKGEELPRKWIGRGGNYGRKTR